MVPIYRGGGSNVKDHPQGGSGNKIGSLWWKQSNGGTGKGGAQLDREVAQLYDRAHY